MKFSPRSFLGLAVLTLLVGSCVGSDSPTGVEDSTLPVSLGISPTLIPSAADGSALPINLIRAVSANAATNLPLNDQQFPVSPNDTTWTIDVSVPMTGATIDVIVFIYLINVAADGTEEVQFSGQSAPITLEPGGAMVTVNNVPLVRGPMANLNVTSVTVTAAPDTLIQGKTAILSATAATSTPINVPQVFWTSLDTTVLTMADSVATGVSAGTAQIVASAGAHADTVSVVVIIPPVDSVIVTPGSADVVIATTATPFTATLLDADMNVLSGRVVTWSTADPLVATVDPATGAVTAVALGSTTITATSEGISGDATVNVIPPPVDSVLVSPDSASVFIGQTSAYTAQLFDIGGAQLTGRPIAWSTGDPTVATVDTLGVVLGIAPGVTTVTATSEGVSDDAIVVVNGAMVVSRWNADGDFTDAVGTNDGTAVGGTRFGVGALGQAFDFDGVDDHVTIGSPADLDLTAGTFSVSAWVRAASTGVDLSILGKVTGINQDGWRLLRQINDRFWFCFGAGTGNGCVAGSPNTVMTPVTVADRWYHVAAVKDGANFSIYLDGVLGEQKPVPFIADSNNPLLIGASNSPPLAFWDGRIDEVEIFNGPLTPTQVDSIFQSITPPAAVDSVHVTPDTAQVVAGNAVAYSAALFDNAGGSLTGRPILWETLDSTVATVDQTGSVTGVAFGTTHVLATSEGIVDSAVVHVDHTGPVIAGWDAARGGTFSLDAGNQMQSARADVVANFPTAAIAGLNQLSATSLQYVDALVISAAFDLNNQITSLTAAEQTALLNYVTGGGCAVLLTDNGNDFFAASQSILAPFGMTSAGIFNGATSATVTSPSSTNVTNGPFGLVSSIAQDFPAGISALGPNGNALATNSLGTALAAIYDDALAGGSGPVLAYSDATFFQGLFSINQNLWNNTIDVCLNSGLPAPAGPLNLNRWATASSGNWSDPARWSKGVVPVAGDSVVIDAGGSYTIVVDVPAVADYVDHRGVLGTTLDIQSGSLTVGSQVVVGPAAVLEISGGTLAGPATVSVAGTLDWNGGSMTGPGTTRIEVGGSASITGSTTLDGRTLENFGTVTYSGGILDMTGDNGAVFDNRAGGVIDIASATDPFLVGTGAPPSLLNAGTFRKTVGTGTTNVEWPITSTGAIDQLSAGSVGFSGGGSLGGTISAVANGSLILQNLVTFTLEHGLTGSGPGVLDIRDATATITAGDTATFSGLSLSNSFSVLTGDGVVLITGNSSWTNGIMEGAGTTRVEPGGTLGISGTLTLDARTIENAGTVQYTGGVATDLRGANGAVFNNLVGGLVDFASVGTPFGVGSGATPSLINDGTISKTVGVGATVVQWPVSGSGLIEVQTTGNITFDGGGTLGVTSAPNGGELELRAGTYSLPGGFSHTGPGFLEVSSATATIAANDTASIDALGLTNNTGALTGAGVVLVVDTLDWDQGNMTGVGVTRLEPTATAVIGTGVIDTRILENAGRILRTGNPTTFSVNNAATINNLAGGVIDLELVDNAFIAGFGGGSLVNSGRFEKTAGTGVGSIVSVVFVNNDTIDLATTGGVTWTGDFTHSSGAVLEGIGQALLTGANILSFDGEVAPGTSPGILDIDVPAGGLTFGSNSEVSIELEGLTVGSQYDQLNFDGQLALDGTLIVDTVGFTPSPGDRFAVMTYVGRGATSFATVNFPSVAGVQLDTTWAEAGTVDTLFIDASAGGPAITLNSWTGAGDGVSWEDAGNWSGGLPIPTDSVVIDLPGNYTVFLSSNQQIAYLDVGGPTGTQTFNHQQFTLTLDSAAVFAANTVYVHGNAALVGAGDVTINGAFNWNQGTIAGTGTHTLTGGSTGSWQFGNKVLDNRTLTIQGSVDWGVGLITLQNGAQIDNQGTFTHTGIDPLGFAGGSGGSFVNNALFIRNGASAGNFIGVDFLNVGQVNVVNGSLTLSAQGVSQHVGDIDIAQGASVVIANGPHEFDGDFTGGGDLFITAGAGAATTFNGAVGVGSVTSSGGDNVVFSVTSNFVPSLDSLRHIGGGAVTFNMLDTVRIDRLYMAGSIISGSSHLWVNDSLAWTLGTFGSTGSLSIDTTATAVVESAGLHTLSNRDLNNYGTMLFTGGGDVSVSSATIVNDQVASMEVQEGLTFIAGGAGAGLVNDGTLLHSPTDTTDIAFPFTNNGVLDVFAGAFDFNSNFAHNAGAIIQGNGILDTDGATVGTYDGDTNPGDSPGALSVEDATFFTDGQFYMELEGTTPGTEYDQLHFNGSVDLAGGDLQIDTLNGFVPVDGTRFAVMTYVGRGGTTFSNVGFPTITGLTFDTTWAEAGAVDTLFIDVSAPGPGNLNMWISPSAGNWNTPSNWSQGTVPVATDSVVIDFPGAVVNLTTSTAVDYLMIGGVSGTQTLNQTGGILTVNTLADIGNGGTHIFAGGTVTGAGNYRVSTGTLDWRIGLMAGAGTTTVLGGGVATLTSQSAKTLDRPMTIDGTMTLDDTGASFVQLTMSNASPLVISATGELNALGDIFFQNGSGGGSVTNNGTFNVINTGSDETTFNPSIQFVNSDSTDVSGALRISTNSTVSTHTGVFTVPAGSNLLMDGGTHTFNGRFYGDGLLSIVGSGSTFNQTLDNLELTQTAGTAVVNDVFNGTFVRQTSGNLTFSATSTIPATFDSIRSAGTLTFDQGTPTTITAADWYLTGGTLGGAADFVVSDSLTWTIGTITGAGTLTQLDNTVVATLTSQSAKTLDRPMTIDGTMTLDDTGASFVQLTFDNASPLVINPGAELNALGDIFFQNGTGGGSVTNNGTFNVINTGSDETTFNPSIQFVNSDSTDVSGALRISTNSTVSTHTGVFTVPAGSNLLMDGGTHTFNGRFYGDGLLSIVGSGSTFNQTLDNLELTQTAGTAVVNDVFNGTFVRQTSGNLTFSATSTIPATFDSIRSAGTLTFDQGTPTTITAADWYLTGGTLGGAADFVVSGSLTWTIGTITGAGTLTQLDNTVVATLTSQSAKTLDRPMTIDGTMTLDDTGASFVQLTFDNASPLVINPGAELNALGDIFFQNGSGGGSVTNNGTFNVINTGSDETTFNPSIQFVNSDSTDVSGALRISTNSTVSTHTGVFTVPAGSNLLMDGGTHTFNGRFYGDGLLSIVGSGSTFNQTLDNLELTQTAGTAVVNDVFNGTFVRQTSGNLTFSATSTIPATFDSIRSAGTLTFDQGTPTTITAADWYLTGGTLGGAADFVVSDSLTWTIGTITGAGTLTQLDNTVVATLTSQSAKTLDRPMTIDGTMTLDDTGASFVQLTFDNASPLVINPGAELNALGDIFFQNGTGGGSVTNNGTFNVINTGSDETTFNPSIQFVNSDSTDVSGALRISTNSTVSTHTGVFTVPAGSNLLMDGGTHTFNGRFYGDGLLSIVGSGSTFNQTLDNLELTQTAGTAVVNDVFNGTFVRQTSGNLTFSATSTIPATFDSIRSAGTLTFDQGTPTTITAADWYLTGGTLGGAADFVVSDSLTWTIGTITGAGTLTQLDNTVVATLTSQSAKTLDRPMTIDGTMTLDDTGASFVQLTFDNASPLVINPGAELNALGDIFFQNGSGGGSVTNNGTFNVINTGADETTINPAISFSHNANAILEGNGSLNIVGTLSSFAGIVNPGTSPGLLEVNAPGTVTFGGTTDVNIELNGTVVGTGYDQLDFADPIVLGGDLVVLDTTAFVPQAGDRYAVLVASSFVGNFTSMTLPTVGGLTFDTAWATAGTRDTIWVEVSGTAPPPNLNAWTGSGDGTSWSDGTNWSQLSPPGVGDSVVVDLPGTYNVVLDQNAQVDYFMFGAASGTQTFTDATNSFSVAITGVVGANGIYVLGTNGNVGGNGTVTIDGSMQWTGGILQGNGSTVIGPGGTLSISGAGQKTFNARTLEVQGTATWTGTGQFLHNNTPTLRVAAGAVFDIQTGASAPFGGSGSPVTLDIDGTLRKSAGTATVFGGASIDNDGLIDVQSDTLSIASSGGTSGGTFTVANGAALGLGAGTLTAASMVNGGGTLFTAGSGALSVAGLVTVDTVAVSAALSGFAASGSYSVLATELTGTGATLTFSTADTARTGDYTQSGVNSSVFGTGILLVSDSTRWTDGIFQGTGTTVIGTTGTMLISGTAQKTISSRTIEIEGSASWSGTGQLVHTNTPTLRIAAGGLFDIQNGATAAFGGSGSPVAIEVNGTLRKSAGTATLFDAATLVTNGVLDVDVGTLTFDGSFDLAASGVIQGDGSLDLGSATIGSFDGEVNPGTSPGALAITAPSPALIQAASSSFNFEVNGTTAGTGYDQLNVSGSVTLNGDLIVLDTTAFVPTAGDRYAVMTFGARSGNFANVTLPVIGGLQFDTVWTTGQTPDTLYIDVSSTAPGNLNAWTGGGDGTSWGDGNNWSQLSPPGLGDSAVVDLPGTYTVVLNQDAQVDYLFFGAASGTQTFTHTINTLTIDIAADFGVNSDYTLTSGTLTGAGTIDWDGGFTWNGLGTISGSGASAFGSTATVAITGTQARTWNERDLVTDANVLLEASSFTINNSAAQWTINAGDTLTIDGTALGNTVGDALVLNNGVIRSIGTGTSTFQPDLQNDGRFVVEAGQINLTGSSTNAGPFEIASAATLRFSAGVHNATDSVFGGTLALVSATTTFNGITEPAAILASAGSHEISTLPAAVVADSVVITGGTLDFATGATSTVPLLRLAAGSLGGTGTLEVLDSLHWTGGSMVDNGVTLTADTVTAYMTGASNKTLQTSRRLNLLGPAVWDQGNMSLSGASDLRIGATGSWDIQGDLSIVNGGGAPSEIRVLAGGTVTRSSGAGTALVSLPFVNDGTVTISTGTMNVGGSDVQTGDYIVNGDALILTNSTATYRLGSSFSGTGRLQLPSGTATFDSASISLPVLDIDAGTHVFRAAATDTTQLDSLFISGSGTTLDNVNSAAYVDFSAGTVLGSGGIMVLDSMDWGGGTLSGTGELFVADTAGVAMFGSTKTLTAGYSWQHEGRAFWTAGPLTVGNSASFVTAVTGTFDIDTNAGSLILNNGTPDGQLMNFGSWTKSAGALTATINTPMDNQGSINTAIGQGNINFNRFVGTNDGDFTIADGSQIGFGAGTMGAASSVTGQGTLQVFLGSPAGPTTFSGNVDVDSILSLFGSKTTVFDGDLVAGTLVLDGNTGSTITVSTIDTAFVDVTEFDAGIINGTAPLVFLDSLNWALGTLAGTGTAILDGGGIAELTSANPKTATKDLLIEGVLDVQAGTLDANGGFALDPSGYVQGDGTLDLAGATVTWSGDVSPGTSPGQLDVTTPAGGIDIQATSTYFADLEGALPQTGHDLLEYSGTITVDGDLVVDTAQGFVPVPGTLYPVMTFGSRTGTFANVSFPVLSGVGLDTVWTSGQSPDTLYIEAFTQFNPAADFDASLLPAGPGGTNPNGNWTYGFSAGLQNPVTTFPDLFEAAAINCNNADIWGDGGFDEAAVAKTFAPCVDGNVAHGTGQLLLHGGPPDEYAHVVFTAPSAMTCTVDADFISRQNLVDADVHVLINGSSDFSDVIIGGPGTTTTYQSNLVLSASDEVSFVVGLGTPPQILHPGTVELDATLTCS